MHVIGRDEAADSADESGLAGTATPPTARLGRYLARDGSDGAAVGLDLNRPHAGVIVGKRGSGKSHTLGVVAEATARADGLAPVVVDPMGAFRGLDRVADGAPVPAEVVGDPRVRADAVPPADWPALVGLDPGGPAGAVVWAAAGRATTVEGMVERVADAVANDQVEPAVGRVARNHLGRAARWGVFSPDGVGADDLFGPEATVLSLSGVDDAPASAVVAAVARLLYDGRTSAAGDGDAGRRLPWLLVDEAHVALDGVAAGPLGTLLTRGRTPGVSLVLATQRPAALPAVALSQADLLVAHRLTSEADVDALRAARPTFLDAALGTRLPEGVGEALVVDDATDATHRVRVRERETPHGGASPRASEVLAGSANGKARGGGDRTGSRVPDR